MEGLSEVQAGEEERVLRAHTAFGGVLDFCAGELGAHGVLEACEVLARNLEADVLDAQGGEAERGVVRVAEDLLEVPGARAGREAGVVVVFARLCLYAEVEEHSIDAALQDVKVVEDGEHGEAVGGGVRVHAAAEGESEQRALLAVLAEELDHGADGDVLFEDTVDSAVPGAAHGLEAVEEAEVVGGDEARGRVVQDVVEEVGVEALHVCVEVWRCACARTAIF